MLSLGISIPLILHPNKVHPDAYYSMTVLLLLACRVRNGEEEETSCVAQNGTWFNGSCLLPPMSRHSQAQAYSVVDNAAQSNATHANNVTYKSPSDEYFQWDSNKTFIENDECSAHWQNGFWPILNIMWTS